MEIPGQKNHNPVLIINLSKWYGGVDTRVFETALALHGRYPYAVMTIHDSPIDKRLKDANLSTIPLPFTRSDPRILFTIIRVIRKNGYKVVDTHNPQSQFWGALAAWITQTPLTITTIHSSYRETYRGLKGHLYEWVLHLNNLLKSRFVAVSESVYEYLQNFNTKEERNFLIHNGIHLPDNRVQNHGSTLFKSLGWGKDNYIVIVIGRLEPEKGHKYLIEALNKVVKKRPQIRCLIVGTGRSQKELETQVKRSDLKRWIHFASFQKDINTLLNASNALCMPSLTEGLPFALLEACAFRLPLLVTGVGSLKKLLKDNQTAIIVPPGNPEALAKGLMKLMDNPEDNIRLGNAAFKLVRDNFSTEVMIAKTLDVYKGIGKPKTVTRGGSRQLAVGNTRDSKQSVSLS